MLHFAVVFFIMAILVALFGFNSDATSIPKILFIALFVLAVISYFLRS